MQSYPMFAKNESDWALSTNIMFPLDRNFLYFLNVETIHLNKWVNPKKSTFVIWFNIIYIPRSL